MTMDSFEQNVLLAILARRNQMFLLATGLVVYTRLSLTHNLVAESWVQNPAFCAKSQGNLHTTMKLLVCEYPS